MSSLPVLYPDFPVRRRGAELDSETVVGFREFIHRFYREHGRDFPWRNTHDPYAILVSEIMLQQTQVDRVSKKYPGFLERYPDVLTLDEASFRDVLSQWRGLGYNRRCLALKQSARIIVERHGGMVPKGVVALRALPGVCPATAAGVLCFAYGTPAP